MQRNVFLTLAILFCLFIDPRIAPAQDSKLSNLLKSAPAAPNSMVYIHPPSLRKLIDEAEMDAELPAEVQEVWMISELDPIALRPQWELGYSLVDGKVGSMGELAKRVGGYVDRIGGTEVVWSPREAYLLPVNSGIGFLRPAQRQLLARVKQGASSAYIPEFLKAESQQPESYLSMMVAMDLQSAFSPVTLESQLGGFDELKDLDTKDVARLLGSVQGFTIIISRTNLRECSLSFSFGASPNVLEPVATEFLSELLKRNGTAAPEVASWKVSVEGNKLKFRGALTEGTLNGLLSIHTIQDRAEETFASSASRKPLT